jgi:GNAT superfamily N-acetyltransferase
MRIRPAVAADLPVVVRFAGGLFAEDAGTRDPYSDPSWPDREGADYYGAALVDDRTRVLIADDGEPRGYLLGRLRPPNPTRPGVAFAELESMFVAAGHRSAGIGEQLVEAFAEWARERGVDALLVSAYAANGGARRFYERAGFAEHSIQLMRRF